MIVYLLCLVLFLVGTYGVIVKRDLVKIMFGYKNNSVYPILAEGKPVLQMVDPVPQALVLTSIVIELGTTAMLVALALRLFERYKTFDITKIRRLKG